MALNGIDISSYQAWLDLSKVPCDFAIVKATQGTGYTNPDCVRAVEQAMSLGKGVGVYHYISGGNAVAEANFFIDSILNWIGKVMICLDWEFDQNSAWGNESYLEQVILQVIARTGVFPMIYAPASRYNQVAEVAKRHNCGLWIAQYADMNPTGYQNTPWNEGAYTCAIRQYSGSGRLNGWNGDLDLDKFYGSLDDFRKYYGSSSSARPSRQPRVRPAPHFSWRRGRWKANMAMVRIVRRILDPDTMRCRTSSTTSPPPMSTHSSMRSMPVCMATA